MDYDDIRIMALSLAKVGLGNPLPKEVQERLDLELNTIRSNGLDIVYSLAMKLADKSRHYEYLVGNNGAIGSSWLAYLLGITNCNPLPQKYNGFNIPFEIFAGIDFNKTLDITLNVAEDIHKDTCEYLDELLKEKEEIEKVSVAGPGFINITFTKKSLIDLGNDLLKSQKYIEQLQNYEME